ncbi:MAG: hypothetical protein PVG71_09520 [Anaerolineae bacterium]
MEEYLTYLAVGRNVAGSTQEQALSAPRFLVQHVFTKGLEGPGGTQRGVSQTARWVCHLPRCDEDKPTLRWVGLEYPRQNSNLHPSGPQPQPCAGTSSDYHETVKGTPALCPSLSSLTSLAPTMLTTRPPPARGLNTHSLTSASHAGIVGPEMRQKGTGPADQPKDVDVGLLPLLFAHLRFFIPHRAPGATQHTRATGVRRPRHDTWGEGDPRAI